MPTSQEYEERFDGYVEPDKNDAAIWETRLPFEIQAGDGSLIAKAMRAYRPETAEEEGIVEFFIEQFAKLDEKRS